MIAVPQSFDDVRAVADPELFPLRVLDGCASALVVFAAGFFGRQDAVWIAEAGIPATCLDTDADRLDQMAAVYPTDWDFIEADAYSWAERAAGKWDVVSVDCPSGHFERAADMLAVWCRLAVRAVVLGCGKRHERQVKAPDGWRVSEVSWRSSYDGGVYWAVVEPA